VETTWGLKKGDTMVYWVDEISISALGGSNLAPILGDNNRTILVVFENVTSQDLDYLLGFGNGTGIWLNNTLTMESIDVGGISQIILPSGAFPIALPSAIDNQDNYFDYVTSSSNALEPLINGIIDSTLGDEVGGEISLTSYIDQSLIVNASIVLSDLGNIDFSEFEILDTDNELFSFFNNSTLLENAVVGLELAYNLTDGALDYLTVSFSLDLLSDDNIDVFGSVSIVRIAKYTLEEIVEKAKRADFPSLLAGIALITIAVRFARKKY
jgi:hypothetical protein